MTRYSHVPAVFALLMVLISGSTNAVPPSDLEPPVFEVCSGEAWATWTYCDDMVTTQVRAYIPNQPHAQGRIRYHLLRGMGEVDSKTGVWTWYADSSYEDMYHPVVIGASINNTDIVSRPEDNCTFEMGVGHSHGLVFVNGEELGVRPLVYPVRAPGHYEYLFTTNDIDWCEEIGKVRIDSILPSPAGSIELRGDSLITVDLLAADDGRKFVAWLTVNRDDWGPRHFPLVLETRRGVVPVIAACPQDTIRLFPHETFVYQMEAIDPMFPDRPEGIIFRKLSPFGYLLGLMHLAEFHFTAYPETVGEVFEVEIAAEYGDVTTPSSENCRFWIEVSENYPPVFDQAPCGSLIVAQTGDPLVYSAPIRVSDPDGDSAETAIFLDQVEPTPDGQVFYDPQDQTFNLQLAYTDVGTQFDVRLGATDGTDTSYCSFSYIHHQASDPMTLRIEKVYDGDFRFGCVPPWPNEFNMDITLSGGEAGILGFNLLLIGEPGKIFIDSASPGTIFDGCGWEYFTWEGLGLVNPPDSSSGRLFRLIGFANTDGGAVRTGCSGTNTTPTVATLHGHIGSEPNLECQYMPMRFFWRGCSDNVLALSGDDPYDLTRWDLLVSSHVFDFEDFDISDFDTTLPSYFGMPEFCMEQFVPTPRRAIDFINGGVDVVCTDSLAAHWRGDINLNCLPFEIADANLFSEYLMYRTLDYVDSARQTAGSDTNADGIPWRLEDLVYLLRTITGEAPEYPVVAPSDTARFGITNDKRLLYSADETDVSYVYLIFDGHVSPELLADSAKLYYAHITSPNRTTCLIKSDPPQSALRSGALLDNIGPILDLQATTYYAKAMTAVVFTATDTPEEPSILPGEFALHQNHPNPFNIETTISFDLPARGEVILEIFNVIGRRVKVLQGSYSAGSHQISWDGTDRSGQTVASGVYYYRLTAGEFVESKKMVLLK